MTSFRDAAMIERFVDTSGWAEWADQTLLFHARAATLFEEVWNKRGRLITTGFVLLELTALLTRPLRMPKMQQIRLLDALHTIPRSRSYQLICPWKPQPGSSGNPAPTRNGAWWIAPASLSCNNAG